jgi:hypothetical protein
MLYKPNFKDPRVQRKVRSALTWAMIMLKEDKPASWSSRYLDKKIGFLHTDLGKYLRENLLKIANHRYSQRDGFSKQYTLNLAQVYKLAPLLGITVSPKKLRKTLGLKLAIQEYAPVFDTAFEYKDQSNRYWHEMQHIRSDIRVGLFAHYGYRFNYDMQNAYPTLITQRAQRTGRIRKPLSTLIAYTQNPNQYKHQLAQDLGVEASIAKTIIVARFNGASLRPQGSIDKMLTRLQMYKLRTNPWFNQLKLELDRAWGAIAKELGVKYASSKLRMHTYLEMERSVINVIRREFSKKNIPIFLEHDGWRAKDYIDPYLLKLQVKKKTGYDVNFVCEIR